MAKITGTHKDGGEAAAYANKLQIEITHWDREPTAEQLAQHPNSEWCGVNSGTPSSEDVYGYDGNEKPIRSTPMQISSTDRWIMFVSIALGVPVCLFLFIISLN